MTNVHTLHTQEALLEEASVWVARLDRGLSAEEEKAFCKAMAASPDLYAMVLNMAELWDRMDVLECLSDILPNPSEKKEPSHYQYSAMAMAACLVVAVMVGMWTGLGGITSSSLWMSISGRAVYETAVGEHSTVNFPDGSQVVLNTDTLLRVKYTDSRRMFMLERGEIHVDVAHDKNRPLTVSSGSKVIQAVGTAFSVELGEGKNVELIVTDGKVLVGLEQSSRGEPLLLTDAEDSHGQTARAVKELGLATVAVSKGEKFLLGAPNQTVEKINSEDIEAKLSWRQGSLVFRGESLAEAIAEISRYTSVDFEFSDKKLEKLRIAGRFKSGDVRGLLKALRDNFNISYQRVGEEKVILGRG